MRVTVAVLIDQANGFECMVQDPITPRVITIYPIHFEPADITVRFDAADSGVRD